MNSKHHKVFNSFKLNLMVLTSMVVLCILAITTTIGGVASADTSTASTTESTSTSASTASSKASAASTKAANQQARLQNIISKGDQEIERRLTTLSSLSSKISAATHLTSSDQSTLSSEVSSTVSGLNSLKTQLDSDTTVASAATDVESIFSEYRVYALVAPKVDLIKVADDQQVIQGKLTTLSQKLQTRITADQQAGKDVSTMQSDLSDLNAKVSAASAISSNIENTVISLQPTDYNSNHSVLSGDNTQLQTAHTDDQAAFADAKNIVSTLESLK